VTSDHDIFDRKLLQRRRNRVAEHASAHDFLLAAVADDFLERLGAIQRRFPVAVNLGAHHGLLGRRLRDAAGIEYIVNAESAWRLLAQCEPPRVQCDEEALPFREQSVDLVVSGLSLHFVNDLPGTLVQIRRSLKPDGLLLAAMLGGETLRELRTAFLEAEEEIEGGASPRVAPFADVRDAGSLLQRAGYALPVVDSHTFTVTYADPLALVQELRGMGAGNVLRARRHTFMRRATLARAIAAYRDRYASSDGRIPATFEILTMTAWAPHESQQQPLRPGSARARLADALGASEKTVKGTKPEPPR
jgi:SAM-dependent methyltransferase